MPSWPSIANPSNGLEEEVFLPQIKDEFEANYVQSRREVSSAKSRWPLSWSIMTEAHYQLLKTFFIANQGSTFSWTHPLSGVTYTCRFSNNSLKSKMKGQYRIEVQCPIEEV